MLALKVQTFIFLNSLYFNGHKINNTIINENKVYVPSSVTNLFLLGYSKIARSLTCFGPYGPSSEGLLETTKIPRSANCEKSNSPCFGVLHVGVGYSD
jgi:hypothetical protein